MTTKNKMNLYQWDEILKPGTPFWTISFYSEKRQIECPLCKGKGEVKLEGKEYECPECLGRGYKIEEGPAKWYIDEKRRVTRVDIHQTQDSDLYRVLYWDEYNGFPAEKVFTSRAKATREVNKLNKMIKEESLEYT